MTISIDYSNFGAIERQLQTLGLHYTASFTDLVSIEIYVEPEAVTSLEADLTNLTGGNLTWQLQEVRMVELPYTANISEE